MKKVSIIVPVYNEEGNVLNAYQALVRQMDTLRGKYDYEIIFTDNHSQDKTFKLLEGLAKSDLRVKVARFSRNFGYQKSIYTGYMLSSGDAVVQFDCDLQDPPELIGQFIQKWEEGYAVVYGIRNVRKESWVMNLVRKAFYRFIAFLSEDDLPKDVGDFRLVDKRIVNELRKLYDYYPYIRGLIASFGYEQTGILYNRADRKTGKSKFRFIDLINLALDGIVNHSIAMLRIATYCGFIIFLCAFGFLFVYLVGRVFFGQTWPKGFATLITIALFSLSLNALFLGIIGEYIGRIYQQVKRRPITIIDRTVNFDENRIKQGTFS